MRTPLNTVLMGFKLLQEEIASLLSEQKMYCDSITMSTGNGKAAAALESRSETIADLSHHILSGAESAVSILNDLLNYGKSPLIDF